MATKNMFIKSISRSPAADLSDTLEFRRGVNVIVGEPNTGKSHWLMMLDFLFGSKKSAAEAFGETLAQKYEKLTAIVEIGGDEYRIERRWQEEGSLTKVFVDGAPIQAKDFSGYLLGLLDIPKVQYPSGNPYSGRTWPELSWRSLLRHIYRRQDSWTEIANKQYEGEQHACLMMFMGIAEILFSDEYGDLVRKEREIATLEASIDQFLKMLNQVSHELISDEYESIEVTPETLQKSSGVIDTALADLRKKREAVISSFAAEVEVPSDAHNAQALSEVWEKLQGERADLSEESVATRRRLDELEDYYDQLTEELARFLRAQSAGVALASFKVTHCPACQKPVKPRELPHGECYVCHQDDSQPARELDATKHRLEFEQSQLEDETKEAGELVKVAREELRSLEIQTRRVNEDISHVESQLKPIRRAAAAILPPEISSIDMEIGRLQERRRQLDRVGASLKTRESISLQIVEMEKEKAKLDAEVKYQRLQIDYRGAGEALAAHMNEYLRSLHQGERRSWTQGTVDVNFRDRDFTFTVAGERWDKKLGATLKIYFLAAYNYGLLALSNHEKYHYPGLTLLDFPPQFADKTKSSEIESFIIDPFVSLVQRPEYRDVQVISTGATFGGLQGAHRIELETVW